jgi:hypothetical protein
LREAAEGDSRRTPLRETVAAVETLLNEKHPATITNLAGLLRLDKSTVSRRVEVGIESGYLINEEHRPKRPARLRPGDPLPEDVLLLPTKDRLLEQRRGRARTELD